MLPLVAKLPRCLVGIGACNNSHYWARELTALGHDVKWVPAQYVGAYVRRGKNDAADDAQNSSGGKDRLGSITRAGNRYLRQMLVVGAMAVIR